MQYSRQSNAFVVHHIVRHSRSEACRAHMPTVHSSVSCISHVSCFTYRLKHAHTPCGTIVSVMHLVISHISCFHLRSEACHARRAVHSSVPIIKSHVSCDTYGLHHAAHAVQHIRQSVTCHHIHSCFTHALKDFVEQSSVSDISSHACLKLHLPPEARRARRAVRTLISLSEQVVTSHASLTS